MEESNTTRKDAFEWAFRQAQFLTPTQHHVLLYCVGHAFLTADNPEKAEAGTVMRNQSYVEAISNGTGLKRDAIRKALTDLQMKAYIQREVRKDPGLYGQQPHRIFVLWEPEADVLRAGLRDGTARFPPQLMGIPSRPAKKTPEGPTLTLVQGYDENAL